VLAVAWWAASIDWARRAVPLLGALGALVWAGLVVEVLDHRRTLIVDFEGTANPLYRAWRTVLPDYRVVSTSTWVLHAAWLVALAALAAVGWRSARRPIGSPGGPDPGPPPSPEPSSNRRYPHRVTA
jgi:hypothetical protein